MYVNHLGVRNIGKLRVYDGGSRRTAGTTQFSEVMKNAAENRIKSEDSVGGTTSCCEQCSENNQLLRKLMIQSLYMQCGRSSLGLIGYGYPLAGTGTLDSYITV